MRRSMVFAAAFCLALIWPLVSGASLGSSRLGAPAAQRAVSPHITLRLRYKTSWVTRLPLKLNKNVLQTFRVCGVWNWPSSRRFTCLAAGSRLPERTVMRMEQSPIAKALRRDDSPGWGMVSVSPDPVIRTPLSNAETGNKYGTFYYRVTLRDLSGKILLTSNKVALVWHR